MEVYKFNWKLNIISGDLKILLIVINLSSKELNTLKKIAYTICIVYEREGKIIGREFFAFNAYNFLSFQYS